MTDDAACDDAEMTARPAHFTQTAPDAYLPTPNAQSHWGDDHLNGPALVGLAARALEQQYGLDEFMPARLAVDLFKAARGVETTATTRLVREGRRVRNSECIEPICDSASRCRVSKFVANADALSRDVADVSRTWRTVSSHFRGESACISRPTYAKRLAWAH
jgi:hypothetical protein